MKKILPIISLLLIAAFVLSSCAQQQESVDTEVIDPETIDVEALVLEKITGQHTLEFVLKEKRTAEEWDEVLDRMIGYGAKINEQEKSLIIEWLLEQQQ
jgi:hypothetical protein